MSEQRNVSSVSGCQGTCVHDAWGTVPSHSPTALDLTAGPNNQHTAGNIMVIKYIDVWYTYTHTVSYYHIKYMYVNACILYTFIYIHIHTHVQKTIQCISCTHLGVSESHLWPWKGPPHLETRSESDKSKQFIYIYNNYIYIYISLWIWIIQVCISWLSPLLSFTHKGC